MSVKIVGNLKYHGFSKQPFRKKKKKYNRQVFFVVVVVIKIFCQSVVFIIIFNL